MKRYILLIIMILSLNCFHSPNTPGYICIHFKNFSPQIITINNSAIYPAEINKYFTRTGYGPLIIKIYLKDSSSPTTLKIYKENHWYKSNLEITLKGKMLFIDYLEDRSYKKPEQHKVIIGELIKFSWV